MSERKKPGLTSRPPGPRELSEFLDGADKPRGGSPPVHVDRFSQPSETTWERPPAAPAAAAPPAPRPRGRPRKDPAEGETVRFTLRLSERHHAMLQTLAKQRRRSMQTVALDILEPEIERLVRGEGEE
jgi:hypothetical protein